MKKNLLLLLNILIFCQAYALGNPTPEKQYEELQDKLYFSDRKWSSQIEIII